MKINIASFGKFGYFLAKDMSKLNQLGNLYTNLPPYMVTDIPNDQCKYNLISSLPYILGKAGLIKISQKSLWSCKELFDSWMASQMTACDIFHCFSSFGLKAHRSARENYGALTIVERGSTHIQFQDQILREEYSLWNIPYAGIDGRVIDKEIEEYDYCDHIIVQSKFAKNSFHNFGISDKKIITLPLGVNLNVFHQTSKKDNKFRVLSVGTLSLRKGSLYLLKALSNINLPNFEYMFNGKIDPEIRDLIFPYLGLINNVGTRPFSELYKIYSQASVFVLPTIEDGFGNVIVEAMACGVPVIATTNCGAADIITDGVDGFIIPIRDIRALRDKIIFLYENPEIREQMAVAALIKAKTILSIDSHGDRALNEFNQCILAR